MDADYVEVCRESGVNIRDGRVVVGPREAVPEEELVAAEVRWLTEPPAGPVRIARGPAPEVRSGRTHSPAPAFTGRMVEAVMMNLTEHGPGP